jgi:hypothetical protein
MESNRTHWVRFEVLNEVNPDEGRFPMVGKPRGRVFQGLEKEGSGGEPEKPEQGRELGGEKGEHYASRPHLGQGTRPVRVAYTAVWQCEQTRRVAMGPERSFLPASLTSVAVRGGSSATMAHPIGPRKMPSQAPSSGRLRVRPMMEPTRPEKTAQIMNAIA